MRRLLVFYTVLGACLASAAVVTAQSPPTATAAAKPTVIGMVQQVTHPALDASARGVLDVLKEHGFADGKQITLDRQNAQNDLPTLAAIAKKFKDEQVDYVVAIGTLPLQNVWAVFKGTPTPVVFTAVADPYAAGVAKSATEKGANLTGIQASPPVTEALQLVLEVLPGVQKVGMIWTATEKNSELATGRARAAAKALHVTLEEAAISTADEVLTAAQALAAKKVEAFFISTDSTVVSALESLVKVANAKKSPLFGNDAASSRRGAVCTLGLD